MRNRNVVNDDDDDNGDAAFPSRMMESCCYSSSCCCLSKVNKRAADHGPGDVIHPTNTGSTHGAVLLTKPVHEKADFLMCQK